MRNMIKRDIVTIPTPGEKLEFDYTFAVRGVSEIQTENLCVVLGLLQPVSREFVFGLGFDDGQGHFRRVAEKIVGLLCFLPSCPGASNNDPASGELPLFGYRMRLRVP